MNERWCDNMQNVRELARALIDAGHGPLDDEDWLYYLEKPWKWEREWIAWTAQAKPNSDDPTDPDWIAFVAALDDLPVIGR